MALLLAHTYYSLLTAPASPRTLCEEAVLRGCRHLVLADLNGLYGLWSFAREAGRLGLQAVFGAEFVHRGQRLYALARDPTGYASLCRLLTDLHLDAHFDLARAAAMHGEGLWLLCSDLRLLPALAANAERDRLLVALPPRGVRATADYTEAAEPLENPDGRKLPDPGPCWPRQQIVEAAQILSLPMVAVREVWFPRKEDRALHLLFLAVKHNRALRGGDPEQDLQGISCAQVGMHLPERGREDEGFEDFPEAVRRAEEVLAQCTLSFAPRAAPVFPPFRVPEGETAAGFLRAACEQGFRVRYGATPSTEAVTRLQRELQVIEQMGFVPYFLVVREIAELARVRGIPYLGRGSAADSLVAYCLGLTDADPIRYRLLFERFLNPARSDLPDIDLDFCWRRRDELLAAVYAHFGHDSVAMIATYNTCGPRAAYQEAAKALGLPPQEAAARSNGLPWYGRPGADMADMLAGAPMGKRSRSLSPEREAWIAAASQRLLQAPRHLGIHPGGVVMVPGRISAFAPLERAAKGVVITQFDMHAVEGVGLVKIDLLGNRALTIVQDTVNSLRTLGIEPPDLEHIAEDDDATAKLLQQGRSLGCFQVESPAMRTLLRQVRAADQERVIQAIALVRPGPAAAGMKDAFVRRARGLEPPRAAHPLLEEVFADTFGIMLYQEDVIRAAMAVAGMDAEAGDHLRRQLGKQEAGVPEQDAFVVAGLKRGLPRAAIEQVWREMARFAGYSFCKAHAVSYGRLSWRCVWLKARWPGPFLTSVLRNEAGYFDTGVYVEELKRHGVRLLPPCANTGEPHFAVLDQGTVRVGLSSVRGLSARTLQAILEARARAPFTAIADFLDRVRPDRDEAENLVLAGALDALGGTRPALLWRLQVEQTTRAKAERAAANAGGVLLREAVAPREVSFPQLPDHGLEERTRIELQVFGYALGAHPVEALWQSGRSLPEAKGCVPCGSLGEMVGRRVRVFGWVVAMRPHHGQDGRSMCFVTLEDGTGIAEATLFHQVHAIYGGELQGRGPFLVRGVVEEQLGGVGLRVLELRAVANGSATRGATD